MGKLERITIDVPEELIAAVRAAVKSGDYATASDVVSEALSEWNAEQARRFGVPSPRTRQELMALIAEGEKGPLLDGPTVMAELRERVAREAKRRGAL
jgi:antitoxin ParD1/3/4